MSTRACSPNRSATLKRIGDVDVIAVAAWARLRRPPPRVAAMATTAAVGDAQFVGAQRGQLPVRP
jgi:hypothetical protein